METATKPIFIGDSKNPIFTGTQELRDIMQTVMLDIKNLQEMNKATRKKLVKLISSNLLEKVQHDIRKAVLNLKAYRANTGSIDRSILEELVDRSLSLGTEKDQLGSDVCLLKKEDLNQLSVPLVAFSKLINDLNADWGGSPKMNWGFCDNDKDGKSESQPHIWVGFSLSGSVI